MFVTNTFLTIRLPQARENGLGHQIKKSISHIISTVHSGTFHSDDKYNLIFIKFFLSCYLIYQKLEHGRVSGVIMMVNA